MPHQDVDIDEYHQGDSLDIGLTIFEERAGGSRQNLKGASIEWLVKADPKDPDSEALLTKQTSDNSIEITDERNGEAVIHVEQGDTDGFLDDTDDEGRPIVHDEKSFHHRARVTDSNGNTVTVVHGEWTITL